LLIETDEESTENPKGNAPTRTTSESGTVAFERTETVRVRGFPDTVSAAVSTDIESGVEEIVRAYDDFFTKTASEPPVVYVRETGSDRFCPAPPNITALTDRITVAPL